MIVLHVIAPAPVCGGMERVVATLSAAQAAAGDAVHVAAVGEDPSVAALPFADRDAVHAHLVRVPPRGYGAERAAIRALCARLNPDVVHAHGYRPDVIAAPAARPCAAATVSTAHGFTRGGLRNRFYEWLQRRALRERDAVAAVSSPLRAELVAAGVRADRVAVLPNACATPGLLARAAARARLGLPADAFIVGWVGRLSREKGPDVLVDAMALLPESISAALVGDGPEARWLRIRAGACGVAARVALVGAVAEASACFAAFDLLALSSRTEGSPMVILEAMAARVPIVATDVGGVRELLGDDGAAFVPAESPRALAAAIRGVADNPEAARARVAQAWSRFDRKFRLEAWVDAYRRLYLQAAERRVA